MNIENRLQQNIIQLILDELSKDLQSKTKAKSVHEIISSSNQSFQFYHQQIKSNE